MIYYSHVNEDNRVEREFIGQRSFDEIICIAGSGERVTALLDTPGVKRFYIIDQNRDALYLMELKLVVLEKLSPPDYLKFLGFETQPTQMRLEQYHAIRPGLSKACALYWDQQKEAISRGVVFTGHFEKFLHGIRPMVRLFLGKGFLKMLNGDYAKFPVAKWRLLAWFFAQKWVYRLFGNRDEAFVSLGTEVQFIPKAIDASINRRDLHHSFMAHLIFNGHLEALKKEDWPPSLQEKVLAKIKQQLQQAELELSYIHADLLDFLMEYQMEKADNRLFTSLSDILSFTPPQYFFDCLDKLQGLEPNQLAVVIRAFLKNRLQAAEMELLRSRGFMVADASHADSTGMYQILNLNYFDANAGEE